MQKRLRFSDLRERGVVRTRPTLRNWIKDRGFPPGQLTGPNCRTWAEDEVQQYLDNRPVAPKPTPASQITYRPGRPRKKAQVIETV